MDNSYSILFFNKDIYDITEQDVIDFFKREREESSIMEFKSGNVKLEKVYKEVAALHNSQGGLLIIGSPIPKKDNEGRESFFGELTRSSFKTKDWLYQKIYSNISPAPINLKIHDVICDDGGIIQILDIPKSINPPHQVLSNGVYYIRYETETKFAPHGLVEALFNRRNEPEVTIDKKYINKNHKLDRSFIYYFFSTILNITDTIILNLAYNIEFYNIKQVIKSKKKITHQQIEKVNFFTDNPTNNFSTCSLVKGLGVPLDYEVEHLSEPFFVKLHVWGDNMNIRKIFVIISPLENKHRIIEDSNENNPLNRITDEVKDIITKGNSIHIEEYQSLVNKLENRDFPLSHT